MRVFLMMRYELQFYIHEQSFVGGFLRVYQYKLKVKTCTIRENIKNNALLL